MDGEPAAGDRRYAAMLLFQFRVVTAGESNKRRLCEKRLILLSAPSGRDALRAAKQRGRRAQHSYLNDSRGRVRFDGIDPGTCVFSLVDLDEETWAKAS